MDPEARIPSTDHRRKWNLEEFEAKAKLRLEEENEKSQNHRGSSPRKRSFLQYRDFKLDLEARINQKVVKQQGLLGKRGDGYYCNVCDCVIKDSINFLDHINGKKHQRNIGMSMQVERSTLEQVQKRFQTNREKRVKEAQEMKHKQDYDLVARIESLRGKQAKVKEQRREQRKKAKLQEKLGDPLEQQGEEDKIILEAMGFGGFASTKC